MTTPNGHGTRRRYVQGCRCTECKAGNAAKERMARARRLGLVLAGKMPTDVAHGISTYRNWGCRCVVCSDAGRAANAQIVRPSSAAERGRASRRLAVNDALREHARHHGEQWTGPELEIASRPDLTARQVAEMIGRTRDAVTHMRGKLDQPKLKRVLGAQT